MTGGRWRVHLVKCLIPRWTRRWCWQLKSETEPLLGVTPHPPVSLLFLSLLFLALPTHHNFLFSSDLTSRLCLTDCVWLPRTVRRSTTDSRKKRNKGKWWGEGTRRRVDFIGRKRDTKRQSAKRGERMGKMSLGKRLGIKTQGNWETKSKPGINGEEDKGGMKVERGKKD